MKYLSKWLASAKECPRDVFDFRCNPATGGLGSSKTALIDWWSFLHIVFGAIYSIPIFWVNPYVAFVIVVLLSTGYEILENSELGICIGKTICCSPHYQGDNFWNSFVDFIFNIVGFLIVFALV
jgi:hypothetical protein